MTDRDKTSTLLISMLLSSQAGILGGVIAGLKEIFIITHFGTAPALFSGILFACVAYGILGGLIGIGINSILQVLPFHQDRKNNRRLLSTTILSASLSINLFLIFIFRAFRDYHAEKVRVTEPMGLLTIVVLLLGAGVVFVLARFIFNRILPALLDWLMSSKGFFATLGVLIIVGLILQVTLSKETEAVSLPYSPQGQSRLAEKSNVIMIMVDTFRPDWLGCYGNSDVSTPNIDALAKDGVRFSTVYAQATHTKPSTAALLTSRYPSEHRAIHKNDVLPPSVTTVAEVFNKAGYYCGGIVTNVNLAPIYNFQQGFNEYTYLPPKYLFGANEAASRTILYGVLRLIRMKLAHSLWVQHFYRSGETVTGYVGDFINREKDKKFFLFVHYMDPHDPYFEHPFNGKGFSRAAMPNPDPKFAAPFKANYTQEVEYMDGWVGKVIQQLKGDGLYDNSLIILTSDHGEEFYEHGGWWHGTTLHEEQVRVPLIIKWPGGLEAGSVRESLTRSIDITPTALDIAGLDKPEAMRGIGLFQPDLQMTYTPSAFSEADHEGNVVRMLRVGQWKYIQTNPENPRKQPPQQLFNLEVDPGEQNNLVTADPARAKEMQALLQSQYQEILAAREQGAKSDLDRDTQERLRALGYTQ
ncbi:MAG: sulfatase [bacterium]|nr:sulfatase [bacterium]